MKLLVTPYHYNLISDYERLSAFFEAIKENSKGIVYDIGTGSGILAIFASINAEKVYSVEVDHNTTLCALKNFESYPNIHLISGDAKNIDFPEKADIIICEMLDTALIDEEQIPVLKIISRYLKKNGKIIPYKILTGIEPISLKAEHICYENDELPDQKQLGDLQIYHEIDFLGKIDENVNTTVETIITKKGTFSGVKLTSFTLLTPNIICGPTPMMNPPMLIPISKIDVKPQDKLKIYLKYKMGGGLNSIRIKAEKISG
ncbi:MAG: 50S ribosomal protein L11 methyltransferase [Methanobacteriaceae archaeon]|nr:50S ribosomal protein L11 methyltransferase [Methanobacteriaceae archaeon]